MVIIFWWMILLWLAAGVGGYFYYRTRRQRSQKTAKKAAGYLKNVAHGRRIRSLSSFSEVLRTYRLLVTIATILMLMALGVAILLTLRPASITIEQPDLHNRDIMLCLDVSGSMTSTDGQLLSTFSTIAKDLKGERIGLTVFDSSSATIIPLTDDYDFLSSQLKTYGAVLGPNGDWKSTGYQDIFNGTEQGKGSSLIGDGLASCVMHFDNQNIKRSRSIILATDNQAAGPQIMTFTQASAFAKQKSVRIYGINPNDFSSAYYTDKDSKEYRDGVLSTGGNYYKIDYTQAGDADVVQSIVKNISDQEATRFKGAPRVVRSDLPAPFLIVLIVLTVASFVILWRLKI